MAGTRLKPRRKVTKESLSLHVETLQLDGELSEQESGRFRGIGIRFDSPIETFPLRTKFRQGAFANTLRQRADRIKILMQHNQGELFIGVPTMLAESADGLVVEASLNNTEGGRNASAALRHLAAIDKLDAAELSISFDAINCTMEEDEDTAEMFRVVTEARLWEISLVNFGADPNTSITEAASLDSEILATPIAEQIADNLSTLLPLLQTYAPATDLDAAAEPAEGRPLDSDTLEQIRAAITALQSITAAPRKAESQGDATPCPSSAFAADVMAMELELADADRELVLLEETRGQNHSRNETPAMRRSP